MNARSRPATAFHMMVWLTLFASFVLASVSPARAEGLPAVQRLDAPLVAPQQAQRILEKSDATRIQARRPSALTSQTMGTMAITAPAEISELARALRNDPDLIYAYVHDQIDFEILFGALKGPVGALVDQRGNAFDQAALMVALLREAGYTAKFVYGVIRLNPTQLTDWLGVDPDPNAVGRLLGSAGIPAKIWVYSGGNLAYVDIDHVWVKATIGGSDYVFDPSFKSHTETPAIDLASAMGYSQSTFLGDALSGASVTADYVQHINRANIRGDLASYAGNLIDYIETQKPAATMEEIIGGRDIEPTSGQLRQTSLPYQLSVKAEWTDIPSAYQTTLRIQHLGIDQTFNSAEIYGKRLTIFYNASVQPELRLDGTLLATGTAVTDGTIQDITLTVDHPYAANSGTYADQSRTFQIQAGGSYFVTNGWGAMGRGWVEKHRDRLNKQLALGGADDSEPVLGETLTMIAYQWIAQRSRAGMVAGQLSNTVLLHHHWLGVTGQNASPYIDMPMNAVSSINLSNDTAVASAAFFGAAGRGSAFEWGVMEQTQPVEAVSTVKLLDMATNQGDKLFEATSANYASIEPQLVNYSASEKAHAEAYLNGGYRVILPQDGNLVQGDWTGIGFLAISANGKQIGHIISGGLKGGYVTTPADADPTIILDTSISGAPGSGNSPIGNIWSHDPIDLLTGAFLYRHDDLTMGSGAYPLSLGFQRSYTSAAGLQDGPLGRGWTHNYDIRAHVDSDGYQGLGEDSPIDAAAAIAAIFVAQDILEGSKPIDRLVIAALIERWFMDGLIENVVTVKQPGNTQQFVKLADGSYNPPPASAASLTEQPDGSYLLSTKHGVELDFSTDGSLATWSEPNGNTVSLTYNGSGRISQVSDGTGRNVSYGYDGAGNLTSYTDAAGKVTTFTYDAEGRMTQVFYPTHPASAFVTNTYGALGRVATQTNAAGETYNYYFAGSRTEEVDPLGNSQVLYFDRHGKTVRAIDKLDNETRFVYDGEQRVVEKTLPEGNRVEYAYDAAHNVTSITRYPKPGSPASPIVQSFTYESTFNRVASATDALGRVTSYTYDADGNLTQVQAPTVGGQVPTISYTYDSRGLRLTATDPEGRVTRYTYDATTGDRISVTVDYGGLNLTTQLAYDAVGNLTSRTDPLGRVTTFAYDLMRQLTQSTAPAPFGYVTKRDYDANGQLTVIRRGTGDATNPWQITTITYTATGKRASVIDPQGDTTTYAYDAMDRLWKLTDPTLATTEFHYNAVGRLIEVIDTLGNVAETHTYTANGLEASVTDAEGNTTTYVYDGFDRRVRIDYPDASYEAFTYNAAGNLTQERTRAGDLISYAYDALNRLDAKTLPGPSTVDYRYDLSGLTLEVTGAAGSFDYDYDSAGRRIRVTDPNLRVVEYAYDAAGNRTRLTYPSGYYVTYAYDALNRLTEVRANGTTLLADYGYDSLSRRVSISYGNGTSTSYTWQLDGDLTGLAHNLANETVAFSYAYNARGQRTSQSVNNNLYLWKPAASSSTSYTANLLNQYASVDAVSYTYDANGNLTDDGVLTYGYDVEGHLTSVSGAGVAASYVYDALGRRRSQTVGGTTTEYLYDGARVIAAYDASGTRLRRFVYGPGLDEPLAMINAGGTVYTYHQDALGSVIALTDGTGTVAERYAYGPFGQTPTVSLLGNPYRYTGRRYDEATGLYHYRARAYSAPLGRFLQPDPIGYGDGLNLYAYVSNDPINLTDPTGLAVGDWWDFPANFNRAREIALQELRKRPNAHNGMGDARRHAEWMRRTTQETNSFTAWVAGTGYELKRLLKGQPIVEMLMDLHNNSVGREAGRNDSPVPLNELWTLPLDDSQYNPYRRSQNGPHK